MSLVMGSSPCSNGSRRGYRWWTAVADDGAGADWCSEAVESDITAALLWICGGGNGFRERESVLTFEIRRCCSLLQTAVDHHYNSVAARRCNSVAARRCRLRHTRTPFKRAIPQLASEPTHTETVAFLNNHRIPPPQGSRCAAVG
ncbi:inward rectifier potassium channel 13 [Striga asiatica]|uniref:Inward rectifier potassium channel 13 n=1 Tax=Striga asiatica TaxID=4170 RepID=A0A5A7Q4S5_STRAF|nr:inward rectifier potassium channel 13 [Striga asiatica]